MSKKKKIRVDLRKNRSKPPRQRDWNQAGDDQHRSGERVRAKGDLSRRRTIIQQEGGDSEQAGEMPAADLAACVKGRVLRVHGLHSIVQSEDGKQYRCA